MTQRRWRSVGALTFLTMLVATVGRSRGAELQLHLDAANVPFAVGEAATYWPDASAGFYRDAVSPSVSEAPILEQVDFDGGSFNALRFDGANDFLSVGGFNLPRGDYTAFVVAAVDPGESQGAFLGLDIGGWNNLDTMFGVGSMNQLGAPSGALILETHGPKVSRVNGLTVGSSQADGAFKLFWVRVEGTDYRIGVDRSVAGSTVSSEAGMFGSDAAPLLIGARMTSDFLDGRIAEIQVWSGAMNATDLDAAIDGFGARYGLDVTVPPPFNPPVVAGRLTVPSSGSTDVASPWSVVATTAAPNNLAVVSPPNRADVALAIGSHNLQASEGILIATVNEFRAAVPWFTVEAVQEGAFNSSGFDFINAMSLATAHASTGAETNGNVAVAYFPFAGGWIGAHVGPSGAVESGAGVNNTQISKIDVGRYRVELPGVDSTSDGLFFAIGGSNDNNVASTAIMPDGAWEVAMLASTDNYPNFHDDDFSFVYVPLDAENLVAGKVNANGSIDGSLSTDGFSVVRLVAGQYEITIDGKTPDDGVLVLGNTTLVSSGGVTAAEDNFLSYAADGTGMKFIVESRDLPGGSSRQDKDFAFAFIDYSNPIQLTAPGESPLNVVPEPSAALLLLFGSACFVGRSIRKRARIGVGRASAIVSKTRSASLACLLIAALASTGAAREKKAFVIGVDGFRPDALQIANTPNIDALISGGAYSFKAQGEDLTFSGPNWSTILHGVHRDRHNVNSNSYAGSTFNGLPDFLTRLESFDSGLNTVRAISWPNIANQPTGADVSFNANDNDLAVVNLVVNQMTNSNPDAIFIHLLDLDHAGHSCSDCYQIDSPVYLSQIETIDAQVGQMLSAMQSRPNFANEDWMVVLTTDHGGTGSGHSGNTPVRRTIPFIVNSSATVPGEVFPPPRNMDVSRTVLTFMGVPDAQFADLDGHAIGFSATAPPAAVLGSNLIFNGDAEFDRGFTVNNTYDQYVSGWDDPGMGENNPRMTVVKYGAGFWPSLVAPGPEDRGANMFIGGTQADSRISQIIDVSDLALGVDGVGLNYTLSAYLGGRSTENDMARLSARFLDADGNLIEFDELGPVTPAERGNQTSLVYRETQGELPVGTRAVEITLVMTRLTGTDNDGYADNLSFILESSQPIGDATGDGLVDRRDLARLAGRYGESGIASFADGDFDFDGSLTLADLALLHSHYNPLAVAPSPAAVPEPSSLLLAIVAAATLLVRRGARRRYFFSTYR